MAQVQIALLGGLSIRSADGDPIRPATRKARALLAFLALARDRIHSRDRLAAMLWGERGEAQAHDSLRHALTEIRKAFEGTGLSPLRTGEGGVELDHSAIEVDAAAFERHVADGAAESLDRAVMLYGGDLLDGFTVNALPFDEWLVRERERLHAMWTRMPSCSHGGSCRASMLGRFRWERA